MLVLDFLQALHALDCYPYEPQGFSRIELRRVSRDTAGPRPEDEVVLFAMPLEALHRVARPHQRCHYLFLVYLWFQQNYHYYSSCRCLEAAA